MRKPEWLFDLTFQDFPDDFTIKTYLGTKVLIIWYCEYDINVLKNDNICIRLSRIDLQASYEEIMDKRNKVYRFCEEYYKKEIK